MVLNIRRVLRGTVFHYSNYYYYFYYYFYCYYNVSFVSLCLQLLPIAMSFYYNVTFPHLKINIIRDAHEHFKIEFTFFVLLKGGDIVRSDYKSKSEIEHILAGLMPENRLACEISLITGLRINDVLSLKTEQVKKGRFTVHEQKTGKNKAVVLPKKIVEQCLSYSSPLYIFPNRLDGREHRTRQAVFKDLKRVARAFHLKENISPHSMRKVYAVEEYAKDGNLKRVQKLLNHSDEAITFIYALSNEISKRKITKMRNK